MDMFDIVREKTLKNLAPLADRMRPQIIKDVLGQNHILGDEKFLNRCIKSGRLSSIILFGPPGTGKTTIAKIIAREIDANLFQLNAVDSGIKEIREVIAEAKELLGMYGKKSILFIDEIHRFSKNQQDALLPYVERGIVTLIGATTENPYFQINNALLSRVTVLELKELTNSDIVLILKKALDDKEFGLGKYITEIEQNAMEHLAEISSGDVRRALNALETAVLSTNPNSNGVIHIDMKIAEESIQKRAVRYDRDGDQHYDVISAFIKSIRGSDPDAALHYLAKMIYAGEDIEFISRRLIILASEDIGNADPHALQVAVSAHEAIKIIGMPEARITLAQATIYLATAPKSNASYIAIDKALQDIKRVKTSVPKKLRDSHYNNAKVLGNGIGYLYPHDYKNNYVRQQYLPREIVGSKYYLPTGNGYEKIIKHRMHTWENTVGD